MNSAALAGGPAKPLLHSAFHLGTDGLVLLPAGVTVPPIAPAPCWWRLETSDNLLSLCSQRPKENQRSSACRGVLLGVLLGILLGILSLLFPPPSSLQLSILPPGRTSPPPWWPQRRRRVTSLSGHPGPGSVSPGSSPCGFSAGLAGSGDFTPTPHYPAASISGCRCLLALSHPCGSWVDRRIQNFSADAAFPCVAGDFPRQSQRAVFRPKSIMDPVSSLSPPQGLCVTVRYTLGFGAPACVPEAFLSKPSPSL